MNLEENTENNNYKTIKYCKANLTAAELEIVKNYKSGEEITAYKKAQAEKPKIKYTNINEPD